MDELQAANSHGDAASPPLRVVQWATGNIGTRALASVIEHPAMDLVGVRVYGASKVGVDAGLLCGLGRPVGVKATQDVEEILACAREDTRIAAGVIPTGTVAAQRTTVSGMRDGKPLISLIANWYCAEALDADWRFGPTGWRVEVDGDLPLEVDIRFPVPSERWAHVSPGVTAHRAVNAVPHVCAAAAGIRASAELPQLIPDLRAAVG